MDPENQPDKIKAYIEAEEKFLLSKIELNSSLVDFGCGIGRHLDLLGARLRYGLGVDIVHNYIAHAKRILMDKSEIEFQVGDIRNCPLERVFDYVICMHNTIGNIREKNVVLNQMKKAANKSGEILIGVYSEDSIESRIEWYERAGLCVIDVTQESIRTNLGFQSDHFSKERIMGLFGDCDVEEISEIGYIISIT